MNVGVGPSTGSDSEPLVVINAVGMTPRLMEHAPRLRALAERGWSTSMHEVLPAVTCTAQASMLTGEAPTVHGVVANGWLYRETGEVRFWQQSNRLIDATPIYEHLRRERGPSFRVAKLFWWFNQGAAVDFSVTPKPHYGADGSKAFGITGTPEGLTDRMEADLGVFPFHTFWGPRAGLPCTEWIARSAAWLLEQERPDLSFVYLPHLDYEPQRHGPSAVDMPRLVGELDEACAPLLEAAERHGARVWVVSEYGHVDVSRPVLINQALRREGWLQVRDGPFGEVLDTFNSRAFAVCDHQLAHVYVEDPAIRPEVRQRLSALPGVATVVEGEGRIEIGLDHPRSGELIALAEPDAWFAYPYWLDEARAPDFARTVDIHRKPGFDPCEMFLDPRFKVPMFRVATKLLRKKLGFRMLMDVIPLDPRLVLGSHGLAATDPRDRPILIADGPRPKSPESPDGSIAMTEVAGLIGAACSAKATGLPAE